MDFKVTKVKLIISFVSGLAIFLFLSGAIVSGKVTFFILDYPKRSFQSFLWSLLVIGIVYLILSFFPKMAEQYKRHRLKEPRLFSKEGFRTVPLNHTNYKGKKKGKAIAAKLKKNGKLAIRSILEEKNGHQKERL